MARTPRALLLAAALARLGFYSSAPWGPGIYLGLPPTHTNLIVIRELPETRDTLLARNPR